MYLEYPLVCAGSEQDKRNGLDGLPVWAKFPIALQLRSACANLLSVFARQDLAVWRTRYVSIVWAAVTRKEVQHSQNISSPLFSRACCPKQYSWFCVFCTSSEAKNKQKKEHKPWFVPFPPPPLPTRTRGYYALWKQFLFYRGTKKAWSPKMHLILLHGHCQQAANDLLCFFYIDPSLFFLLSSQASCFMFMFIFVSQSGGNSQKYKELTGHFILLTCTVPQCKLAWRWPISTQNRELVFCFDG